MSGAQTPTFNALLQLPELRLKIKGNASVLQLSPSSEFFLVKPNLTLLEYLELSFLCPYSVSRAIISVHLNRSSEKVGEVVLDENK